METLQNNTQTMLKTIKTELQQVRSVVSEIQFMDIHDFKPVANEDSSLGFSEPDSQ